MGGGWILVGWRDWLRSISEWCDGGVVGVEGSVTDSHLVPVARAARVVPLSAVAFGPCHVSLHFFFLILKYHNDVEVNEVYSFIQV